MAYAAKHCVNPYRHRITDLEKEVGIKRGEKNIYLSKAGKTVESPNPQEKRGERGRTPSHHCMAHPTGDPEREVMQWQPTDAERPTGGHNAAGTQRRCPPEGRKRRPPIGKKGPGGPPCTGWDRMRSAQHLETPAHTPADQAENAPTLTGHNNSHGILCI